MTKHDTDWACGIGAVSTRMPLESDVALEDGHRRIVDTRCSRGVG